MLTTIILFLVILGLLVFVHEFGHFITAKKLGAGVEEFGFGFPPRMIGVYKEENKWNIVYHKTPKTDKTIYSLNWIPLGGFVKITGEDGSDKNNLKSFANKAIWKRAIILVAGVTMNVILAMLILAIGFGVGLPRVIDDSAKGAIIKDRSVQIVSINQGSAAELAGLASGDEILSIDGGVYDFVMIQDYLTRHIGEEVLYKIKRGDDTFDKVIIPQILPETGRGGVGVGLVEIGIVSYPWYTAVWKGAVEALFYVKEIAIAFILLIKRLVMGQGVSGEISGPVGIAILTGKVARLGFAYLLQFTAILSINLAILNIFPFPALDGGRVLFLAIEAIRRKPMNQKVENIINNLGFMALMLLVLVVTYRDFAKFGDKFVRLWERIIQ